MTMLDALVGAAVLFLLLAPPWLRLNGINGWRGVWRIFRGRH